MERATRTFFSLSPFTLSEAPASLHVFSLSPFTCRCRALGSLRSYGREVYVKPVGLVTPRASPSAFGTLPLPYDIHNVCLFTRPSALPLTAYEFQLEYVLSAPN